MKIVLETLGCKLNQAETESFARQLIEAGHEVVTRSENADIYILNTCTVTQTADSKSRHLLRLKRRRHPNAIIVATGCYTQRAADELTGIDVVDLVVGNDVKETLVQQLEKAGLLRKETTGVDHPGALSSPALRTRAFL